MPAARRDTIWTAIIAAFTVVALYSVIITIPIRRMMVQQHEKTRTLIETTVKEGSAYLHDTALVGARLPEVVTLISGLTKDVTNLRLTMTKMTEAQKETARRIRALEVAVSDTEKERKRLASELEALRHPPTTTTTLPAKHSIWPFSLLDH